MSEVYLRVTEIEVSVFPDELRSDPSSAMDADTWAVRIADRGAGRWAVIRAGRCLSSSGEWDYEPLPFSRDEAWLATHRFDQETAQRLAVEQAPKVTINGYTALEILATHSRSAGEPGHREHDGDQGNADQAVEHGKDPS